MDFETAFMDELEKLAKVWDVDQPDQPDPEYGNLTLSERAKAFGGTQSPPAMELRLRRMDMRQALRRAIHAKGGAVPVTGKGSMTRRGQLTYTPATEGALARVKSTPFLIRSTRFT